MEALEGRRPGGTGLFQMAPKMRSACDERYFRNPLLLFLTATELQFFPCLSLCLCVSEL